MKRSLSVLIAFLFACLLGGCATTRITSEDPHAEIYLDDNLIGVGESEVDRVGPPRRAKLEARKGGQVIGKETMARSFTFKTLLWGMFSYYTGFYWGWYYPASVRIPTSTPPMPPMTDSTGAVVAAGKTGSRWSNPRQSVWMQPLK